MKISSDDLADLLVEVAKTELCRQISSRRCPMREPLQHRARTEPDLLTHVYGGIAQSRENFKVGSKSRQRRGAASMIKKRV